MRARSRVVRWGAAVAVALGSVVVPLTGTASAGAGGGCHTVLDGEPTQGTGTTVETKGACVVPTVLRVEPGTEVTFVNGDGIGHNLFGAGIAVDEFGSGQTASVRYDDPGVFPYACSLHPGMVGAVLVGDGIGGDVVPVATQPIASTAREDDGGATSDSTVLVVLVSVALTMLVAASSYAFGRRSAGIGAHDQADG